MCHGFFPGIIWFESGTGWYNHTARRTVSLRKSKKWHRCFDQEKQIYLLWPSLEAGVGSNGCSLQVEGAMDNDVTIKAAARERRGDRSGDGERLLQSEV